MEGNGLVPTKIHCVSVSHVDEKGVHSTTDYDKMREFFLQDGLEIIGHNFVMWDKVHIERILGIEIKARIVDTLGLSWYLFPKRKRHGLENWGEELRIPKPEISDWDNLSIEDYIHRCESDVKINKRLWVKIKGYLNALYGNEIDHVIDYLGFKLKCASIQEQKGWKIDTETATRNLRTLEDEEHKRMAELEAAMPKVANRAKKRTPKRPFKLDGKPSATGQRWIEECQRQGLDPWEVEEIEVVTGYSEPNGGSFDQIKAWLFSLGWEPCTFKYVKDGRKERGVPQVFDLHEKTELTPSVKKLEEKEPAISSLEGLFLVRHRKGIISGILESVREDGRVEAGIGGFTNTLRFKHKKPLVNLPGTGKAYGKEVRECLVSDSGKVLVGSDMASLEDRTKQHWIYPYDPKYVDSMNKPDFDPHLDIAVMCGMMTEEEAQEYRDGDKTHHWTRHKAKTTNYSATYGIRGKSLSRALGISVEEAEELIDAYWKRNWSIREVEKNVKTKTVEDQDWLWNPVSSIWYSLRSEKDKFSTLNQGTGSYCFDTWLAFVMSRGHEPIGQFHDEFILEVLTKEEKRVRIDLVDAIEDTNEVLGLNRRLDIDIHTGNNYSEIH